MTRTGEAPVPAPRRRWRPLGGGGGDAVAGTVVAVVNATTASAATVDTNAWYFIVNRNSGKPSTSTTSPPPTAAASPMDPQHRQQPTWQFVDSGGGYYRIKLRHLRQGARRQQLHRQRRRHRPSTRQRQQPTMEPARLTGGYVRFISRTAAKPSKSRAPTADNANIVHDNWNGNNQQWQLIPVGTPPPPPRRRHPAAPSPTRPSGRTSPTATSSGSATRTTTQPRRCTTPRVPRSCVVRPGELGVRRGHPYRA